MGESAYKELILALRDAFWRFVSGSGVGRRKEDGNYGFMVDCGIHAPISSPSFFQSPSRNFKHKFVIHSPRWIVLIT